MKFYKVKDPWHGWRIYNPAAIYICTVLDNADDLLRYLNKE